MRLAYFAALQLALLLCPLPQTDMTKRISHPPLHDVDTYDRAGPYELVRRPDGNPPFDQIDRIRGWLWIHWTERRLGLLIVTRFTTEGDRITAHYYIEPDSENRWRIALKVERLEHNYKYNDPACKRYTELYDAAYSLVRLELQTDNAGNRKAITPEAVRPPATYVLSLRDQDGKEIDFF
jgi:hypothetical protein